MTSSYNTRLYELSEELLHMLLLRLDKELTLTPLLSDDELTKDNIGARREGCCDIIDGLLDLWIWKVSK